jgi:mRNA-degrading endonuclease toxin of MazEF toxin-antitoxin module
MLLVTSIAANIAANSHKQIEIVHPNRVNRLFSACQCIHEGFESWRLSHERGSHRRVLADQVKPLDWKIRKAKKKASVSAEIMLHVQAKIKALLIPIK